METKVDNNYQVFGSALRIIKAWVNGVEFDKESHKQVKNIAEMPFIHRHVAIMPDVHLGRGATIGSVIPTERAIIPAAVGVDIGCGMKALKTTLTAEDLPENLSPIRKAIEKVVPHGRTSNGKRGDRGAWHDIPQINELWWEESLDEGYKKLVEKYPGLKKNNSINHLGTLGTGNHFIEMCLDENNDVWFMLHSGSRGIGNAIGRLFIELAKEDMRRFFINLPDKDLSYLPEGTEHFTDYVQAVEWAQNFAKTNRNLMMHNIMHKVREELPNLSYNTKEEPAINCHHNYVAREHHFGKNVLVTRKGAVRAREGDLGIIPGSMGAKSYIVRGKGNPESFHSCSHGAGRVMSRTQAKKVITLEDHLKDTEGVECRKDSEVIDESPKAYKDIDAVMAAQSDLVEIKHTLKQVLCVKG